MDIMKATDNGIKTGEVIGLSEGIRVISELAYVYASNEKLSYDEKILVNQFAGEVMHTLNIMIQEGRE